MHWDDIVWETRRAVGPQDASLWLDGIKDILRNPMCIRSPVPFVWVADARARNMFPHVLGNTWISPHPEAWHKLGYWQIWRPGIPIPQETDCENDVRLALLENEMNRSKL